MQQIKIRKIHPNAQIPARSTSGAAGYDLCSVEEMDIPAAERVLIHTGLQVSIPHGYHMEVRPRSGLALKHGITVLNTPGTVDSDYRGELMIILFNTGNQSYHVHIGDRIAQAIIMRHEDVEWIQMDDLDGTDRSDGGFGSTGL